MFSELACAPRGSYGWRAEYSCLWRMAGGSRCPSRRRPSCWQGCLPTRPLPGGPGPIRSGGSSRVRVAPMPSSPSSSLCGFPASWLRPFWWLEEPITDLSSAVRATGLDRRLLGRGRRARVSTGAPGRMLGCALPRRCRDAVGPSRVTCARSVWWRRQVTESFSGLTPGVCWLPSRDTRSWSWVRPSLARPAGWPFQPSSNGQDRFLQRV